uniref:PB1 domain-containing protein n=1 Tax=Hyaloperonospora arabidopsidis (strain Emoy2) TaxID=559515 RepID=M4B9Z3_HYAAE
MSEHVVLKLSHAGETHRTTVALHKTDRCEQLSYDLVVAKVCETFGKPPCQWTLVYRDDEGDVITVSHALEFDDACHVLLRLSSNSNSINSNRKLRSVHFYVLSHVSFREKLVAPVLQKVVALAQLAREVATLVRTREMLDKGRESFVRFAGGAVSQAGAAMSHICSSDVLVRGRESLGHSAAHTRTLLSSARSGVSTRLQRAGSAVAAGIERRRSASGSSFDGDFMVDDMKRGVSPVVASASAPASMSLLPREVTVTVDLRHSSVLASVEDRTAGNGEVRDEDEETSRSEVEADAEVAAAQESETAYESDADTLCDEEEDREWDIVDDSRGNTANEAVAGIEGNWTRELNVLRSVLVELDHDRCCDLLSQYNGDVEAVLVKLTNV